MRPWEEVISEEPKNSTKSEEAKRGEEYVHRGKLIGRRRDRKAKERNYGSR